MYSFGCLTSSVFSGVSGLLPRLESASSEPDELLKRPSDEVWRKNFASLPVDCCCENGVGMLDDDVDDVISVLVADS